MMVMQQPFTTTSPQLTSVDWFEFGTNTGYKKFYVGVTEDQQFLTTDTFYTAQNRTTITAAYDQDFDIELKTALDIQGKLIIVLPVALYNAAAGSVTVTGDLTLRLRKWDGTTETEVANTTFSYSQSLGGTTYSYEPRAFSFEVPATHYAAGDTIRFSIQFANVAGIIYLFHSSTDETYTGMDTTQLSLHIPFNMKN